MQQDFLSIREMTPDFDDIPLPEGWVEEFHESGHPYYVDTLANPPRSIWIHPYEDEVYLRQHPEDQGKLQAWMAADSKSRSPSPLPDGRSPLYTEDVKVAPALGDERRSSREYYDRRGPVDEYAPGMSTGSHMGDRGLLGGGRGLGGLGGDGRGFGGGGLRGRRGLIGGLLGALTERTEMAQESRGAYYEPRFGMGGGLGGPGMMMGGRGFGMPMDRRTERFMRREDKYERRMQRRQEKYERRMDRRSGGRYAPPAYARPEYYPGQYPSGYYGQQQQYGGGQYYAPPPQVATPHEQEHHGGKVLPFFGGVAVGVAGDELFHHFKDKDGDKKEGKN